MKKTILILGAVYFFTGCSQTRNAQGSTTVSERGSGTTGQVWSSGTTGGGLGSGTIVSGRTGGMTVSELTSKTVRNFWQLFGDSKNENWFHLGNGALAEFEDKGIHYRAFFDRKGNWIYTVKQYTEKEMPKDVRAAVRSIYYDYTIGHVMEVNQAQLVVYLVHIENEQEWKTIRVAADGEMEVAEEFVKY
jgi:hypothetical protein